MRRRARFRLAPHATQRGARGTTVCEDRNGRKVVEVSRGCSFDDEASTGVAMSSGFWLWAVGGGLATFGATAALTGFDVAVAALASVLWAAVIGGAELADQRRRKSDSAEGDPGDYAP